MDELFPIWNSSFTAISLDSAGAERWLDETEVRWHIGRREIGVFRPLGSGRDQMKLFWRGKEKASASEKRNMRRLPAGQPNVIRVTVGDTHRVYTHHAERCQAHYDGRKMPVVKQNLYARPGTPHVRASYKIDPASL